MFTTPIHVMDFEGSRQSGIVEYGVVTLVGSEITAVHTRICQPKGAISEMDRQQHGISETMASSGAPVEESWELFASLRESGPFCAHSASVEDGFLRRVWPCPRTSPDFLEPISQMMTWGPWVDTLGLYRQIYPSLESYKLGELISTFSMKDSLDSLAAQYCPEGRVRYHCALYDTLASALLLRRLYELPELSGVSLRWLLTQSASSLASRNAIEQQDLF